MKTRVEKFHPGGLYCLSGNASANSLFFENSSDQQLFVNLLNRFMGELIVLYGFSTNATGWSLFFVVKDADTIVDVYSKFKKCSKKANTRQGIEDPGLMLSEHFRYFLSAYVKQSNFQNGRHGSRVHSKMEKYVFEDLDDMKLEIEKMKKMEERKVQKRKYRPDMRYYLVDKQLKRTSVWRHSFLGLVGEKLVQVVIPCFQWVLDKTDLLRQLITDTWNNHFGPNNPQNPFPKLE